MIFISWPSREKIINIETDCVALSKTWCGSRSFWIKIDFYSLRKPVLKLDISNSSKIFVKVRSDVCFQHNFIGHLVSWQLGISKVMKLFINLQFECFIIVLGLITIIIYLHHPYPQQIIGPHASYLQAGLYKPVNLPQFLSHVPFPRFILPTFFLSTFIRPRSNLTHPLLTSFSSLAK